MLRLERRLCSAAHRAGDIEKDRVGPTRFNRHQEPDKTLNRHGFLAVALALFEEISDSKVFEIECATFVSKKSLPLTCARVVSQIDI